MRIETSRPQEPTWAAPPQPQEPPIWLTVGVGAAYVVVLAALAFLPGATLIERLRALDGGICAQMPGHSFWIGGQQLPLCARNSGIYMGFASTIGLLIATGRIRASRLPAPGVAALLGLAVLVMAVDGFNSLFLDLRLPHLYQPHNLLRLGSGLGTGVAMAAFLVPVANTLIWKREDERASFGSLRELALLLPLLLLVFLAVGSPAWTPVVLLLYPIAIISSAGLITALSLVNVTLLLGMSNRVGRFATWRQLFPFWSVTVVLAAIELMALFALKSALMPTIPFV